MDFPEEVWKYIQTVTEKCGSSPATIIECPVTTWTENHVPKGWEYLGLRILLWDPMGQYPSLVEDKIFCPQHGNPLVLDAWRNTKTPSRNPRWLYDTTGAVLLVMRTYACKHHNKPHYFTSGELLISSQLPPAIEQPFHLSHRAGFTNKLQHYIVESVMMGQTFRTMERTLTSRVSSVFYQNQKQYCLDLHQWQLKNAGQVRSLAQHADHLPHWEIFTATYCPIPSDSFLIDIFLDHFRQCKSDYDQVMYQLGACYISCDHTFKVSVNVGVQHTMQSSWMTQYDSLFMILNEKGQVLRFQFAKNRSFSAIKEIMEEVQVSLGKQGSNVEIISLDNCCHWAKQVQPLFPNAHISLDIFHAVKRISSSIPQGNAFKRQLSGDLRLVFRSPTDTGVKRTQPTPTTGEICDNLTKFKCKWAAVKENGKTVIPEAAFHAMDNLLKHARKGCLSDIPVGVGTNRNEKLHHFLNNSPLVSCRIGPELATALLTVLLYRWNIDREQPDCYNSPLLPVWVASMTNRTVNNVCLFSDDKHDEQPPSKPIQVQGNGCSSASAYSSVHEEVPEEAYDAVTTAVSNSLECYRILQGKGFPVQSAEYFTWTRSSSLFQVFQPGNTQYKEQGQLLEARLEEYGLEFLQISANGCAHVDSLFSAITVVLSNMKETDRSLQTHLQNVNLSLDMEAICKQLLGCAIDDIVANKTIYEINFNRELVPEEILKWKENGPSSLANSDILICALANILSTTILVITGIPDVPYVHICPRTYRPGSQPLTLAYKPDVPCYYLGLGWRSNLNSNNTSVTNKSSWKGCRCGQGKKGNSHLKSCVDTKYKSRCPCLKKNVRCSSLCKCVGCANPYGNQKTPMENSSLFTPRKRHKHASLPRIRGTTYMEQNKECVKYSRWTDVETFILSAILEHPLWKESELCATKQVFNIVVAKMATLGLPISLKTTRQVVGKGLQVKKNWRVWSCLLQKIPELGAI